MLDAGCSSHAEDRSPVDSSLLPEQDTSGETLMPLQTGKKRRSNKFSAIFWSSIEYRFFS